MKKILLLFCVMALLMLTACAQPIGDIKNAEHIGETVTVKGTVIQTVDLGVLQGYVLADKHGDEIYVNTQNDFHVGQTVKVTGEVKRPLVNTYFIQPEDE